ncbi:AMP-binding protein, partial [Aureobasidium melanogenum]
MCIECRTIEDFRYSLHNARNQVLDEEVSMLMLLNAVFDPLYSLSDAVLVESKHIHLAFDNTSKKTGTQEFGFNQDWRRTSLDETIRPGVEDTFGVSGQGPETSRERWGGRLEQELHPEWGIQRHLLLQFLVHDDLIGLQCLFVQQHLAQLIPAVFLSFLCRSTSDTT